MALTDKTHELISIYDVYSQDSDTDTRTFSSLEELKEAMIAIAPLDQWE